jgi:hypothetical protein
VFIFKEGCMLLTSLVFIFKEGCMLLTSLVFIFTVGFILVGYNTSSAAIATPTIPMIIAKITPDAITILIRFISGFLT